MLKVDVSATIDYEGYIDYYSGHGHAFADSALAACEQFSIPINYKERVGELIDEIISDLQGNIEILQPEYEDAIDKVGIRRIRKALREEFAMANGNAKAFSPQFERDPDNEEEDEFSETPALIGFIHYWARPEK